MKKLLSKCGNALINGFAHLPLGALYVFSDVVFFLLFYVIRYRRKVTEKNLRESFPDYSDCKIKEISRGFYRNFADYIFETLKLAHISDDEMSRRMVFENLHYMDDALSEGKNIVVYFSHCFNWEWATSVVLHSKCRDNDNVVFGQVYRPLKSEWFDKLMLRLRSRFGAHSYKKKSLLRDLLMLKRENKTWVVGFMSDQKPSHGDPTHILKFLNHPTAVITGTETVAVRLKTAVIYWDMVKISRGHYKIVMHKLADDASTHPLHEITDKYISLLQDTIIRQPEIWLWTHKRWKIPVNYPQNEADSSNNS